MSSRHRSLANASEVARWHALSGYPDNVTDDGEIVEAEDARRLGAEKEGLRLEIERLRSSQNPEPARNLARLAAGYLVAGDVETARRYVSAGREALADERSSRMKIGILGSSTVGRTLAARIAELGYPVMIGTRNVSALLARTEGDTYGNPSFAVWHQEHGRVKVGTFAETGAHGEIIFNCTAGTVSLEVLRTVGAMHLNGKILVDVANPLDFSRGMPPSLTVCNTDSLGEQIQRAFPGVRVVKTLNTMTARLMVNPGLVPGDHDAFVSGNDVDAKAAVTRILKEWFGWRSVVDLGDITTARGAEMILPMWLELMGALGNPLFNFHIAQRDRE
jgi:predicted dinucleotide-binding enzyme